MKFIRITLLILSVLISLILSRKYDDMCLVPKELFSPRRLLTMNRKKPRYHYNFELNKCVIKKNYMKSDPLFLSLRECEETCLEH